MANQLSVRKQRLQTLENKLHGAMEAFVEIGDALKEIRDDQLYEEAGFETWEDYLKLRVAEEFGFERRQVHRLISAAVIRRKLPDPIILVPPGGRDTESKKPEWTPKGRPRNGSSQLPSEGKDGSDGQYVCGRSSVVADLTATPAERVTWVRSQAAGL